MASTAPVAFRFAGSDAEKVSFGSRCGFACDDDCRDPVWIAVLRLAWRLRSRTNDAVDGPFQEFSRRVKGLRPALRSVHTDAQLGTDLDSLTGFADRLWLPPISEVIARIDRSSYLDRDDRFRPLRWSAPVRSNEKPPPRVISKDGFTL